MNGKPLNEYSYEELRQLLSAKSQNVVFSYNAVREEMDRRDQYQRDLLAFKSQVLDSIDREIGLLAARTSRPGWSPWALWGAFFGLLYLASEIVRESPPELGQMAWPIIVSSAILDGFSFLRQALADHDPGDRTRSFRRSADLRPHRAPAFVALARSGGIVWLAVTFPVEGFTVAFVLLVYVSMALLAVLTIISPFLIQHWKQANRRKRLEWLLYLLIPTMALCAVVLYFSSSASVTNVQTWQAGSMFAIAALVLQVLLATDESSYLQQALERQRRDLAFDRTDAVTAQQNTNLLVSGLTLGDVVLELLEGTMNLHQVMTQQADQGTQLISAYRSAAGAGLPPQELSVLCESTLKSSQSYADVISNGLEKMKEDQPSILKKIQRAIGQDDAPEDYKAHKEFISVFEEKLRDPENRIGRFLHQYEELKKEHAQAK